MNPSGPVQIGTRLEMFVDDAMIELITGKATLRLNRPEIREIALKTDRPWESNMCGGYKTVFRDGGLFRMYYRAWSGEFVEKEGKTMADCVPVVGDDLALPVRWRGGNVRTLAGRAVRLRFALSDGDPYSFRFIKR